MNGSRRFHGSRALVLSLVAGLALMLAGDRGALTAPPPGLGIDPLDVLDLQVKNNVLIVLDTSGSMKWPANVDYFSVGADDPVSRMYQAKRAIKQVVQANSSRVNFGLATYNILTSQKTLNRNVDFDGDGRTDGPFLYVSADSTAANFYINHLCPDGSTRDGFFCQIDQTFANYDGTNSADVWRSFMNRNVFAGPYPTGCTVGAGALDPLDLSTPANTRCRFFLQSRLVRNNTRYVWNRAQTNIANRLASAPVSPIPGGCPAPPAGLLGYNASPPICLQFQDGVGGPISTFYYTSAIYQLQTGSSCGGGAVVTAVAPCTGNNEPLVTDAMDPELPVAANGTIPGMAASGVLDYDGHIDGDQTPTEGLRADQATPLAGSLDYVRTGLPDTPLPGNPDNPAFPAPGATQQRNFVILVTDGDDTCADGDPDRAAVLAGAAASRLYLQGGFDPLTGVTGDPRHRAETLVVAFASAINPARANVIAQGGSGGIINGGSSDPATAVTGCRPGATCRNAFVASNTQQLVDVLNNALQIAGSAGQFSTVGSVFDAIPEYVATVPLPPPPAGQPLQPFDPMNPQNRYRGYAFRSYQATFAVPNYVGSVRAASSTGQIWEAGQKLLARLETDLASADHSFAELHGGLGQPKPTASAHIDRRIFTTVRNGVDPDLAMLWPPASNVAPDGAGDPAGILDDALGIGAASTPVLSLADLQGPPFRACLGANLPAGCTGTAAQRLAAARHEAREMILAFTAGAQVRLDGNGNPLRVAGQIRYRARTSLLAETTLARPAVVTPPMQRTATNHPLEYALFRDGPRRAGTSGQGSARGEAINMISSGYGLRNPDLDGREFDPRQGTGTVRPLLKPVMSVVYVPANDMLHAFRAGPCPTGAASCDAAPGSTATGPETGGEELWGFVPYDLLAKLRKRMEGQTRDHHTYMMASSVRFAEVFVPAAAPFTIENVTYTGRWRRILFAGRGIGSAGSDLNNPLDPTDPKGGKYYTALDITAPGPFTIASLDTQLPDVLWTRGNPDVQTVAAGSPLNRNPAQAALYAGMGQTWAAPVVSRVNPAFNVNPIDSTGKEYVVHVGSGYGYGANAANEGTRFYTLDAVTGDVIASVDVGDGPAAPPPLDFQNAIVAQAVTFIPANLVGGTDLPNPAGSLTTAVYFGDIHGRIWRVDPNNPGAALTVPFRDLGRSQPIAVAGALSNLNGVPHIFMAAGRDDRVPPPANGFQMVGLQDTGSATGTNISGFPISFPSRYRATVQPTTYEDDFSGVTAEVALFVGTRFNALSGACVSSFDSILFAVRAATGTAAYNLDGSGGLDMSVEDLGFKVVGPPKPPRGPGQPPPRPRDLDQGIGGAGAPPAAQPEGDRPATQMSVQTTSLKNGSAVCR